MTGRDGIREYTNQLTHAVIEAAVEVHRILGPGFEQSVYEEAMCEELHRRRVPFVRQALVAVNYKGQLVGSSHLDLLIGDTLIIELKAVESLEPIYTAQLLSYLKITGRPLGLLINFNVIVLKDGIRRVVLP